MHYRASVKYIPFPVDVGTIDGAVTELKQGEYLILIDSRVSPAERMKALLHETAHLLYNHFYDPRSIREIEAEAESYANHYSEKYSRFFEGA